MCRVVFGFQKNNNRREGDMLRGRVIRSLKRGGQEGSSVQLTPEPRIREGKGVIYADKSKHPEADVCLIMFVGP